MRPIKELINGKSIIYDTGRFDDWCVYIVDSNGNGSAPLDKEYFEEFQRISKNYPEDKVYNDFKSIYDKTTKDIDVDVLNTIDKLVESYDDNDKETIQQWFVVIYAGMIAEENKEYTKLGKRIKHLGVYQVLKENIDPEIAANFSKGKNWRELDTLMKKMGF